MKTFKLMSRAAFIGAAAIAAVQGANAATYITVDPVTNNGVYGDSKVGDTMAGGVFEHTFNFVLNEAGNLVVDLASGIKTLAPYSVFNSDIDFDMVQLDGVDFAIQSTGANEYRYIIDILASAGAHSIYVKGHAANAGDGAGVLGTYSGTITFSAVPEPATWAMMALGFGLAGAGMRRTRRRTKVSFA